MEIRAISRYNYTNNNFKNNKLVKNSQISENKNNVVSFPDAYYGRELVKMSSPSFNGASGLSKAAIDMAMQIPIGDRVAHIMSNIKLGDVVLVGSDFNKAQTALRKFANKISSPIKREFYLPDARLKHNYAFFRHTDGDKHILNINDDVFYIRVNDTHYSLAPGYSSSVHDGNLI